MRRRLLGILVVTAFALVAGLLIVPTQEAKAADDMVEYYPMDGGSMIRRSFHSRPTENEIRAAEESPSLYVFEGWYSSPFSGDEIEANHPTQPDKQYAHWSTDTSLTREPSRSVLTVPVVVVADNNTEYKGQIYSAGLYYWDPEDGKLMKDTDKKSGWSNTMEDMSNRREFSDYGISYNSTNKTLTLDGVYADLHDFNEAFEIIGDDVKLEFKGNSTINVKAQTYDGDINGIYHSSGNGVCLTGDNDASASIYVTTTGGAIGYACSSESGMAVDPLKSVFVENGQYKIIAEPGSESVRVTESDTPCVVTLENGYSIISVEDRVLLGEFLDGQESIVLFNKKTGDNRYNVVPTKEGYIFDGWYDGPASNDRITFSGDTVERLLKDGSYALCARWKRADGLPVMEMPIQITTDKETGELKMLGVTGNGKYNTTNLNLYSSYGVTFEDNALVLNNVYMESSEFAGISLGYPNAKITLKGHNVIKVNGGSRVKSLLAGIMATGNLEINGDGTLEIFTSGSSTGIQNMIYGIAVAGNFTNSSKISLKAGYAASIRTVYAKDFSNNGELSINLTRAESAWGVSANDVDNKGSIAVDISYAEYARGLSVKNVDNKGSIEVNISDVESAYGGYLSPGVLDNAGNIVVNISNSDEGKGLWASKGINNRGNITVNIDSMEQALGLSVTEELNNESVIKINITNTAIIDGVFVNGDMVNTGTIQMDLKRDDNSDYVTYGIRFYDGSFTYKGGLISINGNYDGAHAVFDEREDGHITAGRSNTVSNAKDENGSTITSIRGTGMSSIIQKSAGSPVVIREYNPAPAPTPVEVPDEPEKDEKDEKESTTEVEQTAEDDKSETDEKEADKKETSQTASGETVFGTMKPSASTAGKTNFSISWEPVEEADGYEIYVAPTNTKGQKNKLMKVKTIKKGDADSFKVKSLEEGTSYKYRIKAYKMVDGKKVVISSSETFYARTEGGKYGNAEYVQIAQIGDKAFKNTKKRQQNGAEVSYSIKKGTEAQISAKAASNEAKVKNKGVKYESSNPEVASVDADGNITALKKGSCEIYVYAKNGVYTVIKIKVK